MEKDQGLKEELERMWKVQVKMVPVVVGTFGAVTTKLGENPGMRSELSVHKSAVPGNS